MWKRFFRFLLTGHSRPYVFERQLPEFPARLDDIGLYVHIPFCRQICPYCPYNKVSLKGQDVNGYEEAVRGEAEMYGELLNDARIPSLYVGGGTPSAVIPSLVSLLAFLRGNFNIGSEIGVEIHPDDATPENLAQLRGVGVGSVSLGVQSFQDRLLQRICRPYSGKKAETALRNATRAGFDVVDVDLIFAIPGETEEELARDVDQALSLGITQLSAYPLIIFSFTRMAEMIGRKGLRKVSLWQEWKMLRAIDEIARSYGYDRTSIWTWTKRASPAYTSVTRPRYLGLGAGASSRFDGCFYVNTFCIEEYVEATRQKRFPIALSTTLDLEDRKSWWFFWGLYSTTVRKDGFRRHFGQDFSGRLVFWSEMFRWLGLLKRTGEGYALTETGAFVFNRVEQSYSLDFLNKMWGALADDPWPERLSLG